MDIGFAFGLAVKFKQVELGMNQEALAYQAGMARSFVSGIERGAVKASIYSVCKLGQALGCRPSDLWLVAERLYFEGGRVVLPQGGSVLFLVRPLQPDCF